MLSLGENRSFADHLAADDLATLELVAERSRERVSTVGASSRVDNVASTKGSARNILAGDKLTGHMVSLVELLVGLSAQEVQEGLSFFGGLELELSLGVVVEDAAGGSFKDGNNSASAIRSSVNLVDIGESQVEGGLDSSVLVVIELLLDDQQVVGVGGEDNARSGSSEEATDFDGLEFSGDEGASSRVDRLGEVDQEEGEVVVVDLVSHQLSLQELLVAVSEQVPG